MLYKIYLIVISAILFSTSTVASTESFDNLNKIVKNTNISYKQASDQMVTYFDKISNPKAIKKIVTQSAVKASALYASETKDEFERYDEAIFIGLCKLVQINTDESIYEIIDLLQYDLGVSNNEVLRQRITEIGAPALKHLKALSQNKKRTSTNAKSQKQLEVIQDCISHIEKGQKIDAGVSPCR
jgi:hypothetical protein